MDNDTDGFPVYDPGVTQRNWILGFFVTAASFGLLITVFLLIPRQPGPMTVGQPQPFRFAFDPHLFLNIDEVSLQENWGGSIVRVHIVASNTAAGDMPIDLSELRLALVTEEGGTLEPVMPVWKEGASITTTLPPRASVSANVELAVPNGVRPVAVLAWEDYAFLRYLPAARGTALCPTLRLTLDDLGGPARPLR